MYAHVYVHSNSHYLSLTQLVDELEKPTMDLRFHSGHKQRSDLILNKFFNPSSIPDQCRVMDSSPFILLLLLTFVFCVIMIAPATWGNKLLFSLWLNRLNRESAWPRRCWCLLGSLQCAGFPVM